MPNSNGFSLSDLAIALIQDLQAVAETTATLETREQLETLALPDHTRDRIQTLATTVNTDKQQQQAEQQQQFQFRRESLRLGLQQRQQLIAQAANLRRVDVQRPIPGKFVVTGRVVDDESGVGLPGVKIRAFDRDRRQDDLVGTTLTDQDGFYRLEYSPEQFQERGENAPEIYIQVLDASEGNLYESPKSVELKSGTVEIINARVNGDTLPKSQSLREQIIQTRTRQITLLTERQQRIGQPIQNRGLPPSK